MSRAGRRLIDDFLIPALNQQKYGELLKWLDEDKQIFSIAWSHKNASNWKHHDTIVFQDWDKLKGHYKPQLKGYFMQAKQRFRAALYKLDTVRRLTPPNKSINIYQIVEGKKDDKKKSCESVGRTKKAAKRENQRYIPTSVIRKNTSYIAKSNECSKASTPLFPASSRCKKCKVDKVNLEMQKCYDEYTKAQREQMRSNNAAMDTHHEIEDEIDEKEEMGEDSSKMYDFSMCHTSLPETPFAVQNTTPGTNSRQLDVFQPRLESPLVLIVNTYNDYSPKTQDNLLDYIVHAEIESDSGGALNLSVKSDDSRTSSSERIELKRKKRR